MGIWIFTKSNSTEPFYDKIKQTNIHYLITVLLTCGRVAAKVMREMNVLNTYKHLFSTPMLINFKHCLVFFGLAPNTIQDNTF